MAPLLENSLRRWLSLAHARPWWVLAMAALLGGLGFALARDLSVRPAIRELLSPEARSVQAMDAYAERGRPVDRLTVAFETPDVDSAQRQLLVVADALRQVPGVRRVDSELPLGLIDRNALLIFPSRAELEDYSRELSEAIREAIRGRLSLFDDEESDEETDEEGGAVGGGEGDGSVAPERSAGEPPGDAPGPEPGGVSWIWGELEGSDALSDVGRRLRAERGRYSTHFVDRGHTAVGLLVHPERPSSDEAACAPLVEGVRQAAQAAVDRINREVGAPLLGRATLGGACVTRLVERERRDRGLWSSGLSAALAWLLLLMVVGRGPRAAVCVALPVVVGVAAWLGAWGGLADGVRPFAVPALLVVIGLGTHFALHVVRRYQAARRVGQPPPAAMWVASRLGAPASGAAALAVAGGLAALSFSAMGPLAEAGIAGASGVVLIWASVTLVLPAALFASERLRPIQPGRPVAWSEGPLGEPTPSALRRSAVLVGLLFSAGGVAAGVMSLQPVARVSALVGRQPAVPDPAAVQFGLVDASTVAVVLADTPEEARSLYQQLDAEIAEAGRHPRLAGVESVFRVLVVDEQEPKLELIEGICRRLGRKLRALKGDQRDGAEELRRHCEPVRYSLLDLPEWLLDRFTDADGRVGRALIVTPRGPVDDDEAAQGFMQALSGLRGRDGRPPMVAGEVAMWAEVGAALDADGWPFIAAALLVMLFLGPLVSPGAGGGLAVVLPVAVGLGAIGLASAIGGVALDPFNWWALPLVIGAATHDGLQAQSHHLALGPQSAGTVARISGAASAAAGLVTIAWAAPLLALDAWGLAGLSQLLIPGAAGALLGAWLTAPAALQWLDDRATRRARFAAR